VQNSPRLHLKIPLAFKNLTWSKSREIAIKIKFVVFERTFKMINEDPLELFRFVFCFWNISTKNSVVAAILVHGSICMTSQVGFLSFQSYFIMRLTLILYAWFTLVVRIGHFHCLWSLVCKMFCLSEKNTLDRRLITTSVNQAIDYRSYQMSHCVSIPMIFVSAIFARIHLVLSRICDQA
jgi:hypothetical protein